MTTEKQVHLFLASFIEFCASLQSVSILLVGLVSIVIDFAGYVCVSLSCSIKAPSDATETHPLISLNVFECQSLKVVSVTNDERYSTFLCDS